MSNGHLALLADLLKFADLRVDAVLSAQLADGYKPDATVYLRARVARLLAPGTRGWSPRTRRTCEAAAGLGLRPVFVRRPLEWGPGVPPEDPPALAGLIDAEDLIHLAGQLGC